MLRRRVLLLMNPLLFSGTPAAPVPTAGSDIVTNGGFEGTYVGGLAPNWLADGAVTPTESADVHGGSAAQQLTGAAGYSTKVRQVVTTVTGTWYQFSAWRKRVSGTGVARMALGSDTSADVSASSYTQSIGSYRAISTTTTFALYGTVAGDVYRYDDAAVQPLTLSSLLTLALQAPARGGRVISRPTLTAGTQCGHAIWLDSLSNPANFVAAYHDGTNAGLVKCVAGTWTSLISAAVTYGAARALETRAVGVNVALFYNGAQVGTTQTILDAGFGTKVCAFSTYASNRSGPLEVWR